MKDKKALAIIRKYSPDATLVWGVLMQTMPVEETKTYDKGCVLLRETGLVFLLGPLGTSMAIDYMDLTSLRIPENTSNLEIIQGDKTYIFCGDFSKK